MIKETFLALLLLSPVPGLRAAEAAAQDASPSAASGLQDEDIYYAPEEGGDASGELGASQGAVGSLPGSASYLSHAKLEPFEWGRPGQALEGVELFLNGQYLGKSPLSLDNYMVQRVTLPLTARREGYEEAERPQVKLPVEGPLRVALLSEGAARWYTTPAWILGLGLLGASVAVYNNGGNDNAGLGLAGGGLGVICVSQLWARFVHLPALRREVDAYNARMEAAP
jgi:hypothetical protein